MKIDLYTGIDARLYDSYTPERFQNDVPFYIEEAVRASGKILELGCGTGRITVPIAEAGVDIIGIDLSDDMLDIAREKIGELETGVQSRIELRQGDMRDFQIKSKLNLIIIPFRAFLHLMTVDDQRRALVNIRNHLSETGKLIFNIFDPNLNIIAEHQTHLGGALKRMSEFNHPDSGNLVVEWESRRYNLEDQTIDEVRVYEEFDASGKSLSRFLVPLTLRFVYRFEMEHLLELCGYTVEALYGDFARGPFRAGGEQIWVAAPR